MSEYCNCNNGLVNGQDEIVLGVSEFGKLLSRLAPKFVFSKMNTDEEKQRVKKVLGLIFTYVVFCCENPISSF